MSEEAPVQDNPASDNRALRMLLGLGLILPASICCLTGMVLPTISTLLMSLQDKDPLGGSAEFVGFDNYAQLLGEARFAQAAGFTLAMIGVRLLVVAILPLLLALGAGAFGRAVRIPVRLAFTVPLALYAPIAMALSWGVVLNPALGMVQEPPLASPVTARLTLLLVDGLFVSGLATGLGLIVYLAALRGRGEEPPTLKQAFKPLLASWVVGLLATIALTLQAFDWGYVLTHGGPLNATTTLALYQYVTVFQRFQFGLGAAATAPFLLISLAVGLATGLIVVLARLRLELVAQVKASQTGSRAAFGLILALALLIGVAACGLSAGVIPAGLSSGSFDSSRLEVLFETIPLWHILFINTIGLQTLFVLLFQIPLTYLAALGIGGLRPLGQRSEWLLLLFSPWLFVTSGPLLIALYEQVRASGQVNTALAAAGPYWVSVPILFVLTLFFKGREQAYQEAVAAGQSSASAFFRKIIVSSLPLTLLLALVVLLVRLQSFRWPLIVTNQPDLFPMPVALAVLAGQFGRDPSILGSLVAAFVIPISLFFFVAFGLFQILYMDRLALCGPASPAEPENREFAEEGQKEELEETQA